MHSAQTSPEIRWLSVLRNLIDRALESFGRRERHDFQLFLAIHDIEHTRTKARHPQTNGICERLHKTILQEFYRVTFRRKVYTTIEQLQDDLDNWIDYYNNKRTRQCKKCCEPTHLKPEFRANKSGRKSSSTEPDLTDATRRMVPVRSSRNYYTLRLAAACA